MRCLNLKADESAIVMRADGRAEMFFPAHEDHEVVPERLVRLTVAYLALTNEEAMVWLKTHLGFNKINGGAEA